VARDRSRTDGRERDREDVENTATLDDLALDSGDQAATESARAADRELRLLPDSLPDFADLAVTSDVMPVLSINLQQSGDGLVFEPTGGTAGVPDGELAEDTTTNQSFQTVVSFTIPGDSRGKLDEVSFQADAEGEVQVQVGGETFGPVTGSVSLSLPFGGGNLDPGEQVLVEHRSQAGNSTTTRAAITLREV